ncbi:MAG: hypothetical protein J6J36_02070 [Clostridia bacterium]|nr:hypothetical protein [Clostridia bacterium]
MKLTPQVTQEIFLRVKEQYPCLNVTRKNIETAIIKPVDRDDNLRIKSIEKVSKCQLSSKCMYKIAITSKLLVYLHMEDGTTPSLIFIVRITKEK